MMYVGRRVISEIAVAALVFVVAAFAGWLYLAQVAGPPFHDYNNRHGQHFVPAVMWATGHGFGNPEWPFMAPGLHEFLAREQERWDASQMPVDIQTYPIGAKFDTDRLYIFFMVGVAWWLFGFSWAALNIPMALAYALTGLLVYGICRLGMNRILSLVGAFLFLSSPLVLFYLPSMRDFLRGPPILATVFVCGYLVSHRVSRLSFLLFALFLGAAIGIGVGFRQDAIICLPPALVTLAVGARGTRPFRIHLRLLAILLLTTAFYIPARPVLQMNKNTGGNNAFYLLQGFAYPATTDLHVKPSSYLPVYSTSDFIVHAALCAYADTAETPYQKTNRHEYQQAMAIRTSFLWMGMAILPMDPVAGSLFFLGRRLAAPKPPEGIAIWSDQAELIGRAMLKDLAMTIPADCIAKWYSASIISVRDIILRDFFRFGLFEPNPVLTTLARLHQPIANHLDRWGVWYGLATLLLLSAADTRRALACLAMLLYFCGYVSLCYHWRHALHLQFVAFWPACFLIGRGIAAGRSGWAITARREWRKRLTDLPRDLATPLKRILCVIAVAVPLLVAPLGVARWWQYDKMQDVLENYLHAEIEPLEWQEEVVPPTDDTPSFVLYRPTHIPGLQCLPEAEDANRLHTEPCVGLRTEYLMAEVVTPDPRVSFRLRYEDTDANLDIEHGYDLPSGEIGQTQRYFFPVHEFTESFRELHQPATLVPFVGFSLPTGAKLLGLYRVANREDFPVAMNVWLPSNREAFRWFLGVAPFMGNPE